MLFDPFESNAKCLSFLMQRVHNFNEEDIFGGANFLFFFSTLFYLLEKGKYFFFFELGVIVAPFSLICANIRLQIHFFFFIFFGGEVNSTSL